MYLVGLTGGIASGKSSVAAEWVKLGGIEIDADLLARRVVEPGTKGLAAVVAEFGSEVLKSGANEIRELDRPTLASIVFADSSKRFKLEAIVHPLVRELAAEEIAAAPADSIVIYTVPLLVEAGVGAGLRSSIDGLHKRSDELEFDKIVTVEAPIEKQIERLLRNRNFSRKDAESRVLVQASSAKRAAVADVILNSNQPLDALLKDARRLWSQIQSEASRHGGN